MYLFFLRSASNRHTIFLLYQKKPEWILMCCTLLELEPYNMYYSNVWNASNHKERLCDIKPGRDTDWLHKNRKEKKLCGTVTQHIMKKLDRSCSFTYLHIFYFFFSLGHNIVCISKAIHIQSHNLFHRMPFQCHYQCFPTSFTTPWLHKWYARKSLCHGRDGDNRMIHSLSKEVTASCAFTRGIWDSLGAHGEGHKAKYLCWHTKLVVQWERIRLIFL